MKQITRMAALGVLLLAGVSGAAFANGTSAPEPEPVRYMPPPPPPAAPPAPVDECEEGAYISGAVGIGFPSAEMNGTDYDLDSGLVLNGALGYNFGSVRVEAAVGYQKHDFSDFDADGSMLTVMGNAYYDFDAGSGVKPYIMGGLGMASVDSSLTDSEDVFAWQVGAGIGFEVAECTTLDLGYRYLKPNDVDYFGSDVEIESHNVTLGLRYQF
ncbi:MAG: porin family protein [Chlorobiaceae bacterium]|nr:porin family protein [Chlorobiaceae bacterium]